MKKHEEREPMKRKGTPGHSLVAVLRQLGDYVHSYDFVSLYETSDVLTMGLVCRGLHAIFDQEYVRRVIRLGNLEAGRRYLFWIYEAPYIKYYWQLKIESKHNVVVGCFFPAFLRAATTSSCRKRPRLPQLPRLLICVWPSESKERT